jgi:hypothetical protein
MITEISMLPLNKIKAQTKNNKYNKVHNNPKVANIP